MIIAIGCYPAMRNVEKDDDISPCCAQAHVRKCNLLPIGYIGIQAIAAEAQIILFQFQISK